MWRTLLEGWASTPALAVLMASVVGCAVAPGDADSNELSPQWYEFRAAHLVDEAPGGAVFVIDDMFVGEPDLYEVFHVQQGRQEIPGSTTRVGRSAPELIAEAPFGPINSRDGVFIDYCFSAPDSWGQQNGNVIDGYYIAPDLEPVIDAIDEAARRWDGVAHVQFRHRTDLDGPGCGVALRYSGEIQFWVGHWDGAFGGPGSTGNTAVAPLPSTPNEYQVLLVPPSGIGVALAIHELGHVLGFRHEHERDEATPRCDDVAAYAALTEYDPVSVMMYANCTQSMAIIGLEYPSRLDGIGARSVYGEPHWWWATL